MTSKDFQLIADVIAALDVATDEHTRRLVGDSFATALAQTNPRFNKVRFLEACGL